MMSKFIILTVPITALIFAVIVNTTVTANTMKSLGVLALSLVAVCVVLFAFAKARRLL